MSAFDLLRKSPLFAGLNEEDLAALAGCLGRRVFGKGVIIFHKDSPGHTLYLIESGRVRTFILSDAGQEISLSLYGSGEAFGELAFLDGQPRSTGAITVEPALTFTLTREDFLQCLGQRPLLAHSIIQVLSTRMRYLSGYIESLAFLDVNGRLASRLLNLADSCGGPEDNREIPIDLTQADLASWVASTRESVNKALNKFRDQGLIQVNGRRITIQDRRGLQKQIVM
jgi:CRP/FNR family transcriptional regulator, cyclic AMP receptor protein